MRRVRAEMVGIWVCLSYAHSLTHSFTYRVLTFYAPIVVEGFFFFSILYCRMVTNPPFLSMQVDWCSLCLVGMSE